MGYLKDKYTKEYFTGQDKNGNKLNYGVEGYQDFLNGKIRPIDFSILSQINFKNKRVLELGCGRGEAIKYGIDNGAIQYDAVDFSKNAIDIAEKFLKSKNVKNAKLYCDDALLFLKRIIKKKKIKYDIVIMFDFIEHVPRKELYKILKLINKITHNKSLIAINTPNYLLDNDVIKDGLDQRNNINTVDTSDINEATSGMHCNKYSTISLQIFLKDCGYLNITEQHFFIPIETDKYHNYLSYELQWNKCYKNKFPILKKYKNDVVETAYKIDESPIWTNFSQGHLENINLYLTKSYTINVFPKGEHDEQMFNDFQKNTNYKETIFDIGGFMGVNSLLFSKIVGTKGKIISFEPNPYNLNRMLLNFSNNSELSKNISVTNIALSDNTEDVEFLLSNNVDNGHSSTSRLLDTHVEHTQEHLKDLGFFQQKVYQDTLDDFIDNTKIHPNIIKVDIEGAEHLFLLGAQKFLKTYSPILYIELHSQYCALKCTEIMDILGYKNMVLFEEPDNRILVKYYKENTKINSNNININELEQKIIKDKIITLENKIKKCDIQNHNIINENENLKNQYIELENKIILTNDQSNNLLIENGNIKNQNINLENEKNKLNNKFVKLEKYLIKLINNPIIKTEIKIFRLIKKLI